MLVMFGQITLFPYPFAPSGWLVCDGRQLHYSESETLFYMLQYRFGGSGDMFVLPDLRKETPANCMYCISTIGVLRSGHYDGIAGETMLAFEDPSAENVLECKGQTFPRNKYMTLQQYMGTRFGGDSNTLKVPDLQGKAPKGFRHVMCVDGDDPNFPHVRTPYVGELLVFPYDLKSDRFALCDGSKLPVRQHSALFSLVGDRFGGDFDNFSVPDLRGVAPDKHNYYISLTGVFPTRPMKTADEQK